MDWWNNWVCYRDISKNRNRFQKYISKSYRISRKGLDSALQKFWSERQNEDFWRLYIDYVNTKHEGFPIKDISDLKKRLFHPQEITFENSDTRFYHFDIRTTLENLNKAKLYLYMCNTVFNMTPSWEEYTAQVHGLRITVEDFGVHGMVIGKDHLKIWFYGCPLPPDESMRNIIV